MYAEVLLIKEVLGHHKSIMNKNINKYTVGRHLNIFTNYIRHKTILDTLKSAIQDANILDLG